MGKGIFLGVLGGQIDNIKIFDERFEGPYISIENNSQKAVFQNIDSFKVDGEIIDVLRINHVSLNISASEKYCMEAETKYKNFVEYKLKSIVEISRYDSTYLIEKSKRLCDYIEAIERAIVFSYTSVESFVNLAIPLNYTYERINKNGQTEILNAYEVQRYIDLKTKIKKIICKIYGLETLTQQGFWSQFCELENIRNNIIHLKNTSYDNVIQTYLESKVFKCIKAANKLIEYVITQQRKNENKGTEYLWPRIDRKSKNPIIYETSSILSLDNSDYEKSQEH